MRKNKSAGIENTDMQKTFVRCETDQDQYGIWNYEAVP